MRKKINKKIVTTTIYEKQKFHSDCFKNESAIAIKLEGGGPPTSPPSLFRVKVSKQIFCNYY